MESILEAIRNEQLNVPKHVAIILDGNGRWAKKRNMPRNYGHVQGSKTVEQIIEDGYKMGIEYITVYAFSTENWKRSADEVDALMKLLAKWIRWQFVCLRIKLQGRLLKNRACRLQHQVRIFRVV